MEDRIESYNGCWLGSLGVVEEDDFHPSGACRKHTEVCPFGGDCRAERIRRGGMYRRSGRTLKSDGLRIRLHELLQTEAGSIKPIT
jgi:hypothetical protein